MNTRTSHHGFQFTLFDYGLWTMVYRLNGRWTHRGRWSASRVVNGVVLCLGAVVMISGPAIPQVRAEEATSAVPTGRQEEPVTVRRTHDNLHFQLPPDWPVEKRGGVTAPIPIEEYLGKKFQALEVRLYAIERQLSGFDVRLRALEEASKKPREGLRSGGE